MEIRHILALLVVLMLSGCAADNVEQHHQEEEVASPAEEGQPPVEPETPPQTNEEETEEEVPVGADIQILRTGFDPEELTIAQGSVVTFKNMDEKANIILIVGGERSPRLEKGDTFEHRCDEAGIYEFMDAIFKFKGTIEVQE